MNSKKFSSIGILAIIIGLLLFSQKSKAQSEKYVQLQSGTGFACKPWCK